MSGSIQTRRRVAVGAVLAVLAAVLLLILTNGSGGHRFTIVVPQAASLVSGSDLDAPGRTIGSVTSVEPIEGGHAAKVSMKIDDDNYWPLTTDTRAEIRLGGTVSFSNRYVFITPSPNDSGTPIADDGELPSQNVTVPVESDELTALFTKNVRSDFRRLIGNGAAVMDRGATTLHEVLPKVPPVAEGGSHVFEDLSGDQDRLRVLVRSTGHVLNAVDTANPDLRSLLTGAGQTFNAIAAESQNLQTTLDQLPGALAQTRSTLSRADTTLTQVGNLTDRIGPGVQQLRLTAGPLNNVLGSLRTIAPIAESTLQTANAGAPDITGLLNVVNGVSPQIESIGKQATTNLDCLRPYSPEIVAVGSIWGDWESGINNKDHLLRAEVEHFLPAEYNDVPLTPGQAADLYPGLKYAFPAPPGFIAGQPWFQPQCGAGPDALDPHKDQEAEHPDPTAMTPGAGAPGTGL